MCCQPPTGGAHEVPTRRRAGACPAGKHCARRLEVACQHRAAHQPRRPWLPWGHTPRSEAGKQTRACTWWETWASAAALEKSQRASAGGGGPRVQSVWPGHRHLGSSLQDAQGQWHGRPCHRNSTRKGYRVTSEQVLRDREKSPEQGAPSRGDSVLTGGDDTASRAQAQRQHGWQGRGAQPGGPQPAARRTPATGTGRAWSLSCSPSTLVGKGFGVGIK